MIAWSVFPAFHAAMFRPLNCIVLIVSVLGTSFALAQPQPAFVPANPPEMQPLTNRNSAAHQAARRFMHGVNLGDYLEAPPGQNWGPTYSEKDFAAIRAEGFDHVRLPVGWHHYTGPGPDFTLSGEIFAKADFLVTNALNQQLAVIVNIHHFNEFTTDLAGQTDKFLAIWRQVAAHYAKLPETAAFELLNEPKDAAKTTVLNPIYQRAIRVIRETNPRRAIFVGPGQWNNVAELRNLVLPADDDNLIVTVHCYEPFYFTHQGASWAGPDVRVKGIEFPGPPAKPLTPDPALKLNPWVLDWIQRYNTLPTDRNPCNPEAFASRLRLARQWSDYYGRPVHVGEFGCYVKADEASRIRFHEAFRRALDEQKLGWALWDWKSNFRYWDGPKNQPVLGLREALFGKGRQPGGSEVK